DGALLLREISRVLDLRLDRLQFVADDGGVYRRARRVRRGSTNEELGILPLQLRPQQLDRYFRTLQQLRQRLPDAISGDGKNAVSTRESCLRQNRRQLPQPLLLPFEL